MLENFPYTDLHNLNLDWIIARMKEVLETATLNAGQIALLKKSIAELEAQTRDNTLKIGQIMQKLADSGIPVVDNPSVLTVGASGCMYTKINDAVEAAKKYCTTSNRVTIQIYSGRYVESINLAPNPGIDLIGFGDVTIVKPEETKYPNMCLFTCGNGRFENISFVNTDNNASYAVHYEVQGYETAVKNSFCTFVNCRFQNTSSGSGVGCGGGCNDRLKFVNCEFRSSNASAGYFHNHPANSEQFELTLSGCYFESVNSTALQLDCYQIGYFVIITEGCGFYPPQKTLSLNTFAKYGASAVVTNYIPADSFIVPRGAGGNSSRALDSKPVYLPLSGTMTDGTFRYPLDNINLDMTAVVIDSAYTAAFNQLYLELKSSTVTGAFSTSLHVGFI